MKVYGKCKNCKNEVSYRTGANTRVEFAMRDGEIKNLECKICKNSNEFHIDQLYAKPSKSAQLIAGLVFLFGTPLTWILINPVFESSRNHYVIYIIGGFLLIPVFAFAVLNKQDQRRVSEFNRRKLKGRVHNLG
jgi:hypothetical protein